MHSRDESCACCKLFSAGGDILSTEYRLQRMRLCFNVADEKQSVDDVRV